MFQIFDSGLTQLTPAAHYSGSDASRGRHAGHAPARGEFLVMILLGTRVLGMGPLIVLLAIMQHFKWQLVMLALKPQSISRLVLVWRAR